jgi:hypothetical protein
MAKVRKRLGEILVDSGVISREALENALDTKLNAVPFTQEDIMKVLKGGKVNDQIHA